MVKALEWINLREHIRTLGISSLEVKKASIFRSNKMNDYLATPAQPPQLFIQEIVAIVIFSILTDKD